MKREYREVVFLDTRTGKQFLTRSTAETQHRVQWEGKEYPLVRLEVSSDSHPAFTGQAARVAPSGNRVEAFKKRYGRD